MTQQLSKPRNVVRRGAAVRKAPIRPVAMEVQLGLLGSFRLIINGELVRLPLSAQRLLVFLALHDGMLLRQHVAGSLWPDTTESHAGGSLRSVLSSLHRFPLVEAVYSHLRLSPSVVVDFDSSEAFAHRVLDPQSQDLTEPDLDEALLSEDLLPDWTEDWVLVQREYHKQLRLRALETMCVRLTELGCFGHAVQVALLAVSASPLRESAQRMLVAAHLAEGNKAAAFAQYAAFRELLREELSLEPSPSMLALLAGSLEIDPSYAERLNKLAM